MGLAIKLRSVRVQVWFSIELKFNSFELDSEVLVHFQFRESNEVDVWKMTPLLTDGQMDQNQNNSEKSHFKFRIVTAICKFTDEIDLWV